MNHIILIKTKVAKGLNKLPLEVRQLFYLLVQDLKEYGPVQKSWRNFSPLKNGIPQAVDFLDVASPGSTVRKLSASLPMSYKTWVVIFYTTDFIFAVLYGFLEPLLESAKDVFRNCIPGQKLPIC